VATAGEITSLLFALRRGDPNAESHLFELIYGDLHARAQKRMRRERPGHTLQPTELVHESYLRLIRDNATDWKNRAHFFATAAIVMRNILVDYARKYVRRPNPRQRVELDDFLVAQSPRVEQLLILDEVLTQLAQMDARQARVVELIYFGGLTEEEAAEALGVSVRTIKRDWSSARAWLQAELKRPRK
jgi:RNA polymerase sigma factor (TIGR02999 family)